MRYCYLISCLLLIAHSVISQPTFPLKLSANGRYLVDQSAKPFLYQADTPWMLLVNLTTAEAREYIQTRKAQGFSALQVMLTGFASMQNRNGQFPFADNDFSHPNETYFAHIDSVFEIAQGEGVLLAVAPLWSGCCGEGWAGKDKDGKPKLLNQNGPAKARAFGQWLGKRYGRFQNLMWILGGDNDPFNAQEEIRQLALGLKEAAPNHLLTYHAASTHSSTDVWASLDRPAESWLDVSMVYTYFRGFNKAWHRIQPDVYEVAYAEYRKTPTRPFFLGESTYEGEHDAWGSPLQARKQAYWAMLSGATGHAYGSPNWRCDSTWRQGLQRAGAQSLKHLTALFSSLPWYTLVPDLAGSLVIKGSGPYAQNNYAPTAISTDGRLALTYLPSRRSLTLQLSRLTGTKFSARWMNATTGAMAPAGELTRTTTPTLTPPGEGDWVLVVASQP